jgi:hypothetical protein
VESNWIERMKASSVFCLALYKHKPSDRKLGIDFLKTFLYRFRPSSGPINSGFPDCCFGASTAARRDSHIFMAKATHCIGLSK